MIKLTDIIFEGKLSKSEIKKMRDKYDKTGKLPPHLQKLADLMKKNTKVKDIVVPGLEWMAEGINVRKWVNAVNKGKDVVVYDKKGKRYNLQGGDNKSVQVTDHWEDAGRRNVHPEKTWQTLPLSKIKKIVAEGKLKERTSTVRGFRVKIKSEMSNAKKVSKIIKALKLKMDRDWDVEMDLTLYEKGMHWLYFLPKHKDSVISAFDKLGVNYIREAKERNYKEEYKKFQSSKKSKKYRAELNAYNRKKGTYGNGDKKDASHKGGKIAGFEKESVNRGRAEKSRLKKEGKGDINWNTVNNVLVKFLKAASRDLTKAVKKQDIEHIKHIVDMVSSGLPNAVRSLKLGEGKLTEMNEPWFEITYKDSRGRKKTDSMRANNPKEAKKDFVNLMKGRGFKVLKVVKEGKLTEAKESIFDVAVRVMKDKQHQNYKSKKGMVKVDMQTANLLVKVWKKINPKMKKILSDLGYKNPAQLMSTLWAVAKAG